MTRNCKLRCAAQTQYHLEKREFARWGEYPTPKSRNLTTSTTSPRGKGVADRHFPKSHFSISDREKHNYSQLAVGLMTVALGGGVLASNLFEVERPYSRFEKGATALFRANPERVRRVEIASLAPVDVSKHGPRRETAQPSHVLGSSSIHQQLNVEKPAAIPVPAYLLESMSATAPHSKTPAAFGPKGELAHEYWRAIIGASHVMKRYELYLASYPTGAAAEIAGDRIRELEQPVKKATITQKRVAKVKKGQSTSKQTKPAPVQGAVAMSVKEADTVQCGDQSSFKCRKPLQTLAKNCSNKGLSPDGICIRKNYRTSIVIKR
jgi:hypothetical protein